MSRYKNLDKFLEKKGKKVKTERVKKDKTKLKDKDIEKLVLQMLEDFGYIE
jgi:ribosomal protein L12E/L44/L45/RPP1/RPP2